jgi:uncharacterized protein (TIGR03085 family)
MASDALEERAALVETLRAAGPDAPTLCGDWTTRRLAAHLLLRERSPVELLGRVPSARLQAHAQRALADYAEQHDYDEILDEFAAGPPVWSPMALPPVREAANVLEYVVHNEDVRRAAASWQPRELPAERERSVWAKARGAARLTMRKVPMTVQLEWPGHGSTSIGRGAPRVVVSGAPVELTLLAFGRQRVARVDYSGAAADVAALRAASIAV